MQIAQIEARKIARLAELNTKYTVQDGIKNTAGLIGIISICSMVAFILIMDVFNLIVYLFDKKKSMKKIATKKMVNKIKIMKIPEYVP